MIVNKNEVTTAWLMLMTFSRSYVKTADEAPQHNDTTQRSASHTAGIPAGSRYYITDADNNEFSWVHVLPQHQLTVLTIRSQDPSKTPFSRY